MHRESIVLLITMSVCCFFAFGISEAHSDAGRLVKGEHLQRSVQTIPVLSTANKKYIAVKAPEPSTMFLLAGGLIGLILFKRSH